MEAARRSLATPTFDALAEHGNIDDDIYVAPEIKVPDFSFQKTCGLYLYSPFKGF